MVDAVVVGAGPNGLAAAITVARAGWSVLVIEAEDEVGGGCRTDELTLPGFRHDVCSAIHPFGGLSPMFAALPLADFGLEWVHPEILAAHPLPDGTAGVLRRDLHATADGLGRDGRAYRRLVGFVAAHWPALSDAVLGPLLRPPRHPVVMARFGPKALPPASVMARRFRTPQAKGLWAGMAAHAFLPLERPLTSSAALMLLAAAHVAGWPVAKGGSQAITDALRRYLESLGGKVETGRPVTSLAELPDARAVFFDVMPPAVVRIAGDRVRERDRRKLDRYRFGAAAFKVDYALSEPVPWTNADARRAGTVHLGGTYEEVAASERAVGRGEQAERPFILVGQQSVVDATRAPNGQHTLWAYCHVPNGSTVDMTGAIEAQLERFAPGFRDTVLARNVRTPADLEAHNANYVGGDIAGGSTEGLGLAIRPWARVDPYHVPGSNLFICSAATPPGGGVHGICGMRAAASALRRFG